MTKDFSSHDIKRRNLLKLGGTGALSLLLVGCQLDSSNTTNSTASAAPKPSPTPTPHLTPTDADWSRLSNTLKGSLVRPNSNQYATARQLFSPAFDSVHPQAIAYGTSTADVQACLAFAQRFNLPVAPRCGGHSYAGYSTTTGVILDVTQMNTVTTNSDGTATIGAGARLIDVYSALAQQGVVIPAGSCSTVGISGLTMGGGAGVIGRKFGLTCDNLLSAQLVLANGHTVTCDANTNADLFWAIRGGGGGNFGVATSFTFQTHAVSGLSIFTLRWPWSSTAAVVNAWQHWAPQAPDELWSNCLLATNNDKSADPIVQVNGVYVGSVDALNPILQQLTGQINATPISNYVAPSSVLDTMLYEAGCFGKSVAACRLPTQNPQGILQREAAHVKSDYYTQMLPQAGINALIKAINIRQASTTLGNGGIGMDALGGAINRIPATATAFVHRNALFSAQYSGSWDVSAPQSTSAANQAWLNATWQSMRPYAGGSSYQNYVDPDLANWQQAYYGQNLARLRQIKTKYDPHNFFHFAQSIPPA